MVHQKLLAWSWAAFLLVSCGGGTPDSHVVSGSVPLLLSTTPSTAAPGTSVRLTGTGFSFVPQENIVALGDFSVPADEYTIGEDGSEQIQFTIPNEIDAGENQIFVIVEGEVSNVLSFTVTP